MNHFLRTVALIVAVFTESVRIVNAETPSRDGRYLDASNIYANTAAEPAPSYDEADTEPTPLDGGAETKPTPLDGGTDTEPTPLDGGTDTAPTPLDGVTDTEPTPLDGGTDTEPKPLDGEAETKPTPLDNEVDNKPTLLDGGADTEPTPLNGETKTEPTPLDGTVSGARKPLFDNFDSESPYMFENHNPRRTESGLELFESDMVLTDEQRSNRKASANLWPAGTIPYTITSSSLPDRAIIQAALAHWARHTCYTFQLVMPSYRQPHIRFIKAGGCWSYVGFLNRPQAISIGRGCAHLSTIVHEIGHALGFYHEQSRPDRDSYITIITSNILPGREINFGKHPRAGNYGVPYDLSSVMHYGRRAFSRNGQDTIVVNQPQYRNVIGRRAGGLSHRDKHLANLMRNCAAACTDPPRCQNGGFVNKECTCTCPGNTAGELCDLVIGHYYGNVCGDQGITEAGNFTSIGYPSLYPPGQTCYWVVTAPEGKRVLLDFGEFRVLYRYANRICYWDWVQLYLDGDAFADGLYCGRELRGRQFTSTGRRLVVVMKSYHRSYPSLQDGFSARVSFIV